ncbi:hypothetical protein VKT23_014685 [Stygiomarasmius scandens]|uniref:Uncharacterized protein n=1 Tax=Marasmiellus scandens TaxID=2682957 RepID=A0ABR1J4L6_9AGAR
MPAPNYFGYLTGWVSKGSTTVQRYPTLSSLPDTRENRAPSSEATTPSPEQLSTPTQSVEEGPVTGASGHNAIATPVEATPRPEPIPNADVLDGISADGCPVEVGPRDCMPIDPLASSTLPTASSSSTSTLQTRQALGRRRVKKFDYVYVLPPLIQNPRLRSVPTRQGFHVRYYRLCNDEKLANPPSLGEEHQENDLFLHIHRSAIQKDLNKLENVLNKHVAMWCYDEVEGWERIEFGQERQLEGKYFALTLNKRLEPSWILPETIAKDPRWKSMTYNH